MIVERSGVHHTDIAQVAWSGEKQIVKLPAGFHLDGTAVHVRREGGAVILEPITDQWTWLQSCVQPFDDDAVAAMEEVVPQQSRPELDGL